MMIGRLILATLASGGYAIGCGMLFPRVPEWAAYPFILLMFAGLFGLWYIIAVGVRRGA